MDDIARIIELPQKRDKRGNLSFFEGVNHIPFKIAHTSWIYDVPEEGRFVGPLCGHGSEFIVALSGNICVSVNNLNDVISYFLRDPSYGLYVPRENSYEVNDFSTNAVVLVVSSDKCDNTDDQYNILDVGTVKNA